MNILEMLHRDLEDLIIEDWTWRKTEVSKLILLAEETKDEVVLKSIILLLYAHWEGYVKKCSKVYLKFVSESNTLMNELTDNFKAVSLKGVTKACLDAKDSLTLQNELTFIKKIGNLDNKRFVVDIDLENDRDANIINTRQNLTPSVFKSILDVIGLNYKSQYETREKYIDAHLLASRNSIGHGTRFNKLPNSDFYLEINQIKKLRDVVVSIIENFRDELIEYSKEKYFLKVNNENLKKFLTRKELELEVILKEIDRRYE